MNCPVCTSVELKMSDRHGIEVDYCPKCRGVWLDRGELDKIIERAAGSAGDADDAPIADPRSRGATPPGARPGAPISAPPPGAGYPGHASSHPMPPPGYGHPGHPHGPVYDPNDDSKYGYVHRPGYPPPKRKSIWREIFDFD